MVDIVQIALARGGCNRAQSRGGFGSHAVARRQRDPR
jgi:hypothetical protein